MEVKGMRYLNIFGRSSIKPVNLALMAVVGVFMAMVAMVIFRSF